MKLFIAFLTCLALPVMAQAACPSKSPSASKVKLQTGDQKVNKAWLEKTLVGKKVKFTEGTEIYDKDGSYQYKVQNGVYDAPEYRFYDTGFRCIDYPTARFDFYVVNNKKLYLINSQGGRYEGKITR